MENKNMFQTTNQEKIETTLGLLMFSHREIELGLKQTHTHNFHMELFQKYLKEIFCS
jgi:hypothetical protein